jgi:hypothetical protein
MMSQTSNPKRLQDYRRQMLRSAFVSLFWSIIQYRRKTGKLKLQDIADSLGRDKSVVSRWFSPDPPNWTVDTIADISGALNIDLRVEAVERSTGLVFSPSGLTTVHVKSGVRAETETTTSGLHRHPLRLVVDNDGGLRRSEGDLATAA